MRKYNLLIILAIIQIVFIFAIIAIYRFAIEPIIKRYDAGHKDKSFCNDFAKKSLYIFIGTAGLFIIIVFIVFLIIIFNTDVKDDGRGNYTRISSEENEYPLANVSSTSVYSDNDINKLTNKLKNAKSLKDSSELIKINALEDVKRNEQTLKSLRHKLIEDVKSPIQGDDASNLKVNPDIKLVISTINNSNTDLIKSEKLLHVAIDNDSQNALELKKVETKLNKLKDTLGTKIQTIDSTLQQQERS